MCYVVCHQLILDADGNNRRRERTPRIGIHELVGLGRLLRKLEDEAENVRDETCWRESIDQDQGNRWRHAVMWLWLCKQPCHSSPLVCLHPPLDLWNIPPSGYLPPDAVESPCCRRHDHQLHNINSRRVHSPLYPSHPIHASSVATSMNLAKAAAAASILKIGNGSLGREMLGMDECAGWQL